VVKFMPRLYSPWERTPVPFEPEAGWTPETAWDLWREEKICFLPGRESRSTTMEVCREKPNVAKIG